MEGLNFEECKSPDVVMMNNFAFDTVKLEPTSQQELLETHSKIVNDITPLDKQTTGNKIMKLQRESMSLTKEIQRINQSNRQKRKVQSIINQQVNSVNIKKKIAVKSISP